MSNLNLSNNDWKLVVILIDLLKPFYVSTNLLQTQQYHTLSTGKIIENALRKYFDNKINNASCIGIDKLLSNSLIKNIYKYLDEKINSKQKNLMLVS